MNCLTVQSSLTIVSIVDSSHKTLNSATDLDVAQVLLLNDIAHDLHLDGLDRLERRVLSQDRRREVDVTNNTGTL